MAEEILINTLYTGDYTNKNIGHEIINLYQTDKGERYLYVTPYGAIGKEHDDKIKYVLLVREGYDKSTEIIAKAEVERLPENCYPPKSLSAYNVLKEKREQTDKPTPNQEDYMGCHNAQLQYIVNNNISYAGISLDKIISENAWKDYTIYLTFKVKKLEKPVNPLYIDDCKVRNSSMRRFISSNDKELYKFIINKLNEVKWKNCTNNDDTVKEIEKYEQSFLNVIHKENDECVFSDLFKYVFYENIGLFKKFAKEILNIDNIGEVIDIKREDDRIDLLIITTTSVVIIENKIKAHLHGERWNKDKNSYTNQLIKYYDLTFEKMKKEDKNFQAESIKCFVFKPDYNSMNISQLTDDIAKKYAKDKDINSKIKIMKLYKEIKYSKIYKFFNENLSEIQKSDKYIKEFLQALKKHTDDTDKTVEHEMDAKFKDAILKVKNKQNIHETQETGSWTKEMIKPENLIGPFNTTEELMKSLWDEE